LSEGSRYSLQQAKHLRKLLVLFLPLQICVNPRLSAAKKSFPYFLFFRFPNFLRLSYFKPLNSYHYFEGVKPASFVSAQKEGAVTAKLH